MLVFYDDRIDGLLMYYYGEGNQLYYWDSATGYVCPSFNKDLESVRSILTRAWHNTLIYSDEDETC